MKNKLTKLKYVFLAVALLLGSFMATGLASLKTINVAEANGTSCGDQQIIAGTTDYISAEIMGNFGGTCKPGVIYGGIPGVSFDAQYMGQTWCSNGWSVTEYATQYYDATNFPTGASLPATYSVLVEANFDSGGECETYQAYVNITVVAGTPPAPDFSVMCSPSSQTITAGDTASFSISTTQSNGFTSGINISGSVAGSGNLPTISSYSNNGAAPDATTVAVINTTASTSPGAFTITFTGTGGGQTHSCSSQLTVNAPPPSFTLSVSPSSGAVLKGANAVFNVTANCGGSFAGPVTNLTASSFYTNVTYTFSSGTIACGQTITLTVGNTAAVSGNQLSNPQSISPQTITVTGQGTY